MPNSIDPTAQSKRRREAWLSILAATGILILTGSVFLALGCCLSVPVWVQIILVLIGLFDLGTLIPVWKLLKIRLLEIEGGEEDAASQY